MHCVVLLLCHSARRCAPPIPTFRRHTAGCPPGPCDAWAVGRCQFPRGTSQEPFADRLIAHLGGTPGLTFCSQTTAGWMAPVRKAGAAGGGTLARPGYECRWSRLQLPSQRMALHVAVPSSLGTSCRSEGSTLSCQTPPPFPGLGPYCQSPHVAMLWPDMAIGAEGAGSKTLWTAAYHTNGNDACPHGHMAHTDHLSAHTEGYKYTMPLRTLQSRMLQQHLGIPQGMIQGVQGAHVGATAALPFVWFVGLSLSKDYQRQMLPKKTPNPKKINKKLRLFW